ncbi:hypothetical protein FA95DRAFT_1283290 [Auriscalpium vulgare]|uniref:Uncharacterized protein n=1 Tax=Auriscalpium vulgare TaxID=40419 RepID=A0ACB8RSM8_9AGAM|nr:hypothetical protein FA95DRAFT_1283290 [Auriscalpium vulgare]
MSSRADLLSAAQSFCSAFAAGSSLDTVVAFFSTQTPPLVIEYGLPAFAPFLGRPFNDTNGVVEYFTSLTNLVQIDGMTFSDYVVDAEVRKVSVKGTGRFTWRETGQAWDETFTYTLDFDDALKVTKYQVWADSGALYLARTGKLNALVN